MKDKTPKPELSDRMKTEEELKELDRLTAIVNNRDKDKPLYIRKKGVYTSVNGETVCIMSSEEIGKYISLYAKYYNSVTMRGGFKKGKIKTIPPVDEKYKKLVRNNGRTDFYF